MVKTTENFITYYGRNIQQAYKKTSNWGKVLTFITIFILIVYLFQNVLIKKGYNNNGKEGFEQNEQFLFKNGSDLYDQFYSEIYDYLVFSKLKDQYEIGEIINKTSPTNESIILDIGCGTGHHVGMLADKGLDVLGIDISPSMVSQAQKNYPNYKFKVADALNSNQFTSNSFTHIMSLYFTIYYIKDKIKFFENCYKWLMPGGYLIVHLVDRDNFDPLLPIGNPLIMVSPQKYAKKRITNTKAAFKDFSYSSKFNINNDENTAIFVEKFKNKTDGKIRKHEHQLYIPSISTIVNEAQETGFILEGQIDLIKVYYEYQYLYIFYKPN
jgi:SAM-dependent methyltransferase